MSTKLETIKILDIQWGTHSVPKEVKDAFFEKYVGIGNDVWVEYTIGDNDDVCDICPFIHDKECPDECPSIAELKMMNLYKDDIVDKWLLENTDAELGETIMIKHWW